MKKFISIILAIVMVLSLASCDMVKRVERDEDGKVMEKSYNDMTFDEKLEYVSSKARKTADVKAGSLLAPASPVDSESYGFINLKGEWVIEPKYTYAYSFSQGYAPVLTDYTDFDYIRADGTSYESPILKNLSYTSANHFSEGYVVTIFVPQYDQTRTYLSLDGQSQITAEKLPLTNGIKYGSKKYFMIATPFYKSFAVVMRLTNAKLLEEKDINTLAEKNLFQSAYVINQAGEPIATLPAGYDVFDYSLNHNSTIIVRDMTTEDQHYGLCDLSGNILIPCDYHLLEYCEDNIYLATNEDGFFGYLDMYGNKITNFDFISALPFSEGYAAVCDREGQWGIINKKGTYVIEPMFSDVAPLKYQDIDFSVGVGAMKTGVFAVRYDAYWVLMNKKYEIVDAMYCRSEESPYYNVSKDYIVYNECENGFPTGRCGLLTLDGKEVLKPEFSHIGFFGQ